MIWRTRICNPWLTLRLPPAPPSSHSLLLRRFADVLFLLFFTLLFFFFFFFLVFALQVSSGSLSPVRKCSVVCGVLTFLSRFFFSFLGVGKINSLLLLFSHHTIVVVHRRLFLFSHSFLFFLFFPDQTVLLIFDRRCKKRNVAVCGTIL